MNLMELPVEILEVTYSNKIKKGETLSVELTQIEPSIKYNYQPDSFYSLLMIDPDAPSRTNPTKANWLHWMIVNIGLNKPGEIIWEYYGPAPPKESGPHRYFFILLKQPGLIKLSNPPTQREKFNLAKFIEQNQMKIIASNYFRAENK